MLTPGSSPKCKERSHTLLQKIHRRPVLPSPPPPPHTLLQVKYILGIRATKSSRLQDMLLSMGQHIRQVRWQECVMGASWLALLFSVRAISKHSKRGWVAALGPILTAGFSMAAVWLLGLPEIDTVGHIRHGLPGLTVQWWWPVPAGE